MKRYLMLVCAALFVGCVSHGGRVQCDGQLQPINQPAPLYKSTDPAAIPSASFSLPSKEEQR